MAAFPVLRRYEGRALDEILMPVGGIGIGDHAFAYEEGDRRPLAPDRRSGAGDRADGGRGSLPRGTSGSARVRPGDLRLTAQPKPPPYGVLSTLFSHRRGGAYRLYEPCPTHRVGVVD